jgi:hypothetical protein
MSETVCFAERESVLKNPSVFTDLGFRHITAFAQVSFYYDVGTPAVSMAAKAKPAKSISRFAQMDWNRAIASRPQRFSIGPSKGEQWDTWLNDDNEFRDLPWLQKQPPGRRGLHLGGWFAHDTFPDWHGGEAAKLMAAKIARLFPGEDKPIDLLYIDHEGTRTSQFLSESLADLLPLCKKASNFNRFKGPGWWGENPESHGPIDVGGMELYGAGKNLTRFKRAIRLNPGCVPIGPVCSMDTDWSRIAPWNKVIDSTRNLLEYWHEQDERNRVLMLAPYMLNEGGDFPLNNYFAAKTRLGFGRSIEYMSNTDRMIEELNGES